MNPLNTEALEAPYYEGLVRFCLWFFDAGDGRCSRHRPDNTYCFCQGPP